jgi:hypothetical protein
VQPLDWTGGAVFGMLRAGAPLATPFLDDAHFDHDVAHPFVRRLRARFVESLASSRPRFVIQVWTMRAHLTGPGMDHSFPELESMLSSEYRAVFDGNGYRILERLGP